jgi:hypothetical protein
VPVALHTVAGRERRQTKTEKIRELLNELELPNAGAVYVGDLESDILYCREVPLDVIAVGMAITARGSWSELRRRISSAR